MLSHRLMFSRDLLYTGLQAQTKIAGRLFTSWTWMWYSPCTCSSAAGVRRGRCRRSPCTGSSAAGVRRGCCRRSPCTGPSACCVRRGRSRHSPCTCSSAAGVRRGCCCRSPCTGPSACCVRRCRSHHSPCTCSSAACVRRASGAFRAARCAPLSVSSCPSRQSLCRWPQVGQVAQEVVWKGLSLFSAWWRRRSYGKSCLCCSACSRYRARTFIRVDVESLPKIIRRACLPGGTEIGSPGGSLGLDDDVTTVTVAGRCSGLRTVLDLCWVMAFVGV